MAAGGGGEERPMDEPSLLDSAAGEHSYSEPWSQYVPTSWRATLALGEELQAAASEEEREEAWMRWGSVRATDEFGEGRIVKDGREHWYYVDKEAVARKNGWMVGEGELLVDDYDGESSELLLVPSGWCSSLRVALKRMDGLSGLSFVWDDATFSLLGEPSTKVKVHELEVVGAGNSGLEEVMAWVEKMGKSELRALRVSGDIEGPGSRGHCHKRGVHSIMARLDCIPQLDSLDFWHNSIHDEGIKVLIGVLLLRPLRRLRVAHDRLKTAKTTMWALGNALSNSEAGTTLNTLSFQGCKMSSEGGPLLSIITNLEEFKFPNLQQLELGGNELGTCGDMLLRSFGVGWASKLKHLNLEGVGLFVNFSKMAIVRSGLSMLRRLELPYGSIQFIKEVFVDGDADVVHLSLTEQVGSSIRSEEEEKVLCFLFDAGCMSNLEVLKISMFPPTGLSHDFAKSISKLTNLRSLELSDTRDVFATIMRDDIIDSISSLKRLRTINFHGMSLRGMTRLGELFASLSDELRFLDLGHCCLGDGGVELLSIAIANGSLMQLESLDLSGNGIEEKGFATFAKIGVGPGKIKRLSSLTISQNRVVSIDELCTEIMNGNLPTLKHLDVGGCHIRSLKRLCAAIEMGALSELRHLDVQKNNLRVTEVSGLAGALLFRNMAELRHLNVSQNAVGSDGAVALSAAMEAGALAELRFMDFKDTAIGTEGVVALATRAAVNPRFTSAFRNIDVSHVTFPPKLAWPEGKWKSLVSAMRLYHNKYALASRATVFLVGNSTHGKTTLADALDPTQQLAPHSPADLTNRTIGLNLRSWNLPDAPSPDDVGPKHASATIFDLAGQELYGASHALFRSSDAVYFLVVKLVDGWEKAVTRWTLAIAFRNPSACVFLVVTGVDLFLTRTLGYVAREEGRVGVSPRGLEREPWEQVQAKVQRVEQNVVRGFRALSAHERDAPILVGTAVVDARPSDRGGNRGAFHLRGEGGFWGKPREHERYFAAGSLEYAITMLGIHGGRKCGLRDFRHPRPDSSTHLHGIPEAMVPAVQEGYRVIPASVESLAIWLVRDGAEPEHKAPMSMAEFASSILSQPLGERDGEDGEDSDAVSVEDAFRTSLLLSSMGLVILINEGGGPQRAKVILDVRMVARAIRHIVRHDGIHGETRALLTEHPAVKDLFPSLLFPHAWVTLSPSHRGGESLRSSLRLALEGRRPWKDLEAEWEEEFDTSETSPRARRHRHRHRHGTEGGFPSSIASFLRTALADAHFLAELPSSTEGDSTDIFVPSAIAPWSIAEDEGVIGDIVNYEPVDKGRVRLPSDREFDRIGMHPLPPYPPESTFAIAALPADWESRVWFGRIINFPVGWPEGYPLRCLASLVAEFGGFVEELTGWGVRLTWPTEMIDVIFEHQNHRISIVSSFHPPPHTYPVKHSYPLVLRSLLSRAPTTVGENPCAGVTKVLRHLEAVLGDARGTPVGVFALKPFVREGEVRGTTAVTSLPDRIARAVQPRSTRHLHWARKWQWKEDELVDLVIADVPDRKVALSSRGSQIYYIRRRLRKDVACALTEDSMLFLLPDEAACDWGGEEEGGEGAGGREAGDRDGESGGGESGSGDPMNPEASLFELSTTLSAPRSQCTRLSSSDSYNLLLPPVSPVSGVPLEEEVEGRGGERDLEAEAEAEEEEEEAEEDSARITDLEGKELSRDSFTLASCSFLAHPSVEGTLAARSFSSQEAANKYLDEIPALYLRNAATRWVWEDPGGKQWRRLGGGGDLVGAVAVYEIHGIPLVEWLARFASSASLKARVSVAADLATRVWQVHEEKSAGLGVEDLTSVVFVSKVHCGNRVFLAVSGTSPAPKGCRATDVCTLARTVFQILTRRRDLVGIDVDKCDRLLPLHFWGKQWDELDAVLMRAWKGADIVKEMTDALALLKDSVQFMPEPEFSEGARYDLRKVIGGGGYGMVVEAKPREHVEDPSLAVKAYRRNEEAKRELTMLLRLRNEGTRKDYFVEPLGICDAPRHWQEQLETLRLERNRSSRDGHMIGKRNSEVLVLKKYQSSLQQWIQTKAGSTRLEERLLLWLQCTRAVSLMHDLGIEHMDLKPENILMADDRIVLADLGSATPFSTKDISGIGITPAYSPPKDERGERASGKADVWALGLIGFELVFGLMTKEELEALKESSVLPWDTREAHGVLPDLCRGAGGGEGDGRREEGVSTAAVVGQLNSCCNIDSRKRPTAVELKESLKKLHETECIVRSEGAIERKEEEGEGDKSRYSQFLSAEHVDRMRSPLMPTPPTAEMGAE